MKDKIYETRRNRLIPEAERFANLLAGPKPKPKGKKRTMPEQKKLDEWSNKFNLLFHGEMDRMVNELRLRGTS